MKTSLITFSIVAALMMAASQTTRADDRTDRRDGSYSPQKSANEIIGQKVVNPQGQDLGKIQDIIINVDSGRAPYAVIATGGFASRTRVAVPLRSLHCSAAGKSEMVISATEEELQAASKTPTGAWAPVASSDWARKVNGFYGQPMAADRFGHDSTRESENTRTYVRDPAPKGAELLVTPQDAMLCEKITEKVDLLHVQVQNGVAYLYGQVESEEARQKLENQVRSVDGVTKVESHLRVKNQNK